MMRSMERSQQLNLNLRDIYSTFCLSQFLQSTPSFNFNQLRTCIDTQELPAPFALRLDKASVLGDAIMYIKQQEEQVKILDENATKYREEQTIAVKRSARIISSNGNSSSFRSENFNISTDKQSLPEIEVRTSNGNVLIKFYCKKQISRIIKEKYSANLRSSISPLLAAVSCVKMDNQFSKTAENDDANSIRMGYGYNEAHQRPGGSSFHSALQNARFVEVNDFAYVPINKII
ncbi:hypothetical protein P3L10_006659 [Capsicum annuum]